MRQMKTGAGAVILCAGFAAVAAHGAVSALPFHDPFEAQANGTAPSNVWEIGSDPTVYVTNMPSAPTGSSGSQHLHMTDASSISLEVAERQSNVWWQGFTKVIARTGIAPDIGDSVAGFYVKNVSGNNRVFARDNGAWEDVGGVSVALNNWLGFVVHLDYVNQDWDLYMTEGPVGSIMTRLNSDPMAFAQSRPVFTNFTVSGETKLDEVIVTRGYTHVDATSTAKVKVKFVDRQQDMLYPSRVPNTVPAGPYAKLGGSVFGDRFKEGMRPGDQIKFWDHDEAEERYQLDGHGAWLVNGGQTALSASQLSLIAGETIHRIFRNSEMVDNPVFYAWDYHPDNVATQVVSAPAMIVLNKIGGTPAGWTQTTASFIPVGSNRTLSQIGLNKTDAPDLPEGSVCITMPPAGYIFYRSEYDYVGGQWLRRGRPSADTVVNGEIIMIFNPTGADVNWTPRTGD